MLPILRQLSEQTNSTALLTVADAIAILAGRPAAKEGSDDVRDARQAGFALSFGALQAGAIGIAAPIANSDWATASIGIVQLGVALADPSIPEVVMSAAAEATRRLSGDRNNAEATA